MPRSDSAHGHRHRVDRSDKEALVKRLNRIAGQVEGITRMIAADRYCVDIVTQIAAVRSALDALGLQLLREHAHGCVQQAVRSGSGDAAINELMEVVQRFAR